MKTLNILGKNAKVAISGLGMATAAVQFATAGIGLYKAIKEIKSPQLVECDEIKVSEITEDRQKVEVN